MLTILTWLWKQPGGRTTYTAQHVNVWANMVRRNCSLDYRLACVTDMPSGIDPSVEIIPLPNDFEGIVSKRWGGGRPNCFRRLSMFRRDAAEIFGSDRIASFDLDCIIGGDLAPVLDRPEDLVLFKGTAPERPYNGSLMLLTAGCRTKVYEKFNQRGADISGEKFCGSDQAWLAHILGPKEATWDERDGVWFFGRKYMAEVKRANPTILFFPGKRKPWELYKVFPYMRENYRLREAV